jgi:hypothetical protein
VPEITAYACVTGSEGATEESIDDIEEVSFAVSEDVEVPQDTKARDAVTSIHCSTCLIYSCFMIKIF